MKNSKTLRSIYSASFLLTVHAALLAYINSSFLEGIVGENYVGAVFTIGAICTFIVLTNISTLLSKFGNFRLAAFFLSCEFISLLGLVYLKKAFFVIPVFVAFYMLAYLIRFNMDVFVEHFSDDSNTGDIRGTFLTINNIAWVISPFIAGLILTNSDFWKIYLISALLLISVFIIIYTKLRGCEEATYDHPPFMVTVKQILSNRNLYNIFCARFFLQFFFAWMIIYTPIYLHQHIGFHWDQLGVIFAIMLLPYALFELPIGRLADSRFGEKEILSAGFVIAALSTAAISFTYSTSIAVWAAILFATRVGAALIEVMSETYFFKQVDDSDVNLISSFRNTQPMAYIISPLIASVFLYFFEYKYLFLFLGAVTLLGLRYSLALKDTK